MAFQISGTTVVNDSRELQNIASLDSTTTATVQAAAAPSTTYGEVGTYAWGRPLNNTTYAAGDTASGFNPIAMADVNYYVSYYSVSSGTFGIYNSSNTLSGTWRAMGSTTTVGSNLSSTTLWVRIS